MVRICLWYPPYPQFQKHLQLKLRQSSVETTTRWPTPSVNHAQSLVCSRCVVMSIITTYWHTTLLHRNTILYSWLLPTISAVWTSRAFLFDSRHPASWTTDTTQIMVVLPAQNADRVFTKHRNKGIVPKHLVSFLREDWKLNLFEQSSKPEMAFHSTGFLIGIPSSWRMRTSQYNPLYHQPTGV